MEFEDATIALLTEHADRIEALELAHKNLYLSLILALKQSGGIDLVKAVPANIPTIIGVPSGNDGDGGVPAQS